MISIFWNDLECSLSNACYILYKNNISAVAERIFSLLKCSFGEQQLSALEANVTQRIFQFVKKNRDHVNIII